MTEPTDACASPVELDGDRPPGRLLLSRADPSAASLARGMVAWTTATITVSRATVRSACGGVRPGGSDDHEDDRGPYRLCSRISRSRPRTRSCRARRQGWPG